MNDQKNYTTIGNELGTCADAFSNDVPLSQDVQTIFSQVAETTEGPINLIDTAIIGFLEFGVPVHELSPEPVSGICQGRTRNDVRPGGRRVPEPRTSGSVGTSQAQEAQLRADIAEAEGQVAGDIWVNQAQVNAQGQMVGINRLDLQYTRDGQHYYLEYERSADGRGFEHAQRIKANYPSAIVQVKIIK